VPDIGGTDACKLLTSRHPELLVLLVSVEHHDTHVSRRSGAAAFANKQDLSARLLREVWRTARARRRR
jgi:hypothetical protein